MVISKHSEQIILEQLFAKLEGRLLGKRQLVRQFVTVLLAGGHILLEDVPGVGKTMLAETFAAAISGVFHRLQFTSDTMPADVVGGLTLTGEGYTLAYRPGPIMANLVLVDEINRAMSRTQSALLEAMEEREVTVDGQSYRLPDPFMLIATQNPLYMEGTNRLPEAQLDRFMAQLSIGYPAAEDELQMLQQLALGKGTMGQQMEGQQQPLIAIEAWREMQQTVHHVYIEPQLLHQMVKVIQRTRHDKEMILGISPRGAKDWVRAAQAAAYMASRTYVIPEDIVDTAMYVLPHRLHMRSSNGKAASSGATAPKLNDPAMYINQLLPEYFSSFYWTKERVR